MNIYNQDEDVFESLRTMEFDMSFYHALPKYEQIGFSHSEETKEVLRLKSMGNTNKRGKSGYTLSEEFKQKCKDRLTKDNPARRADVREKLRKIALAKEPIVCPHCFAKGDPANMKRWHFDNCKLNR